MTKTFGVDVSSTEKTREILPAKTYLGICYSVIDLGTHDENFQGTINTMRKIKLTREIPSEKRVFSKDKGEQPMVISKDYTLSFGEKANLKKMFDSRGIKIQNNFQFETLLGKPALLSIGVTDSKNGGQYNNINWVSDVIEWMLVPPQTNTSILFNCYDFDMEEWNKIHSKTQDKIKQSQERTEEGGICDKYFTEVIPF